MPGLMTPGLTHALSVGLTLALLLVGYHILQRLIDRLVARVAARQHDPSRARTLGSLFTSVVRWGLAFTVLIVILRELGVDVQSIVVSAGVVGIVIGFGAQTLIRDLLSGIFLLFEGLVAVGDVIQVGSATGTVESVGLRVTKLRLQDGALRIVPNGALTEFTNFGARP
jgi:moderate conductance mechanosensitive channel